MLIEPRRNPVAQIPDGGMGSIRRPDDGQRTASSLGRAGAAAEACGQGWRSVATCRCASRWRRWSSRCRGATACSVTVCCRHRRPREPKPSVPPAESRRPPATWAHPRDSTSHGPRLVEGKLAALVVCGDPDLACGREGACAGGSQDSGDPVKLVPKLAGGNSVLRRAPSVKCAGRRVRLGDEPLRWRFERVPPTRVKFVRGAELHSSAPCECGS